MSYSETHCKENCVCKVLREIAQVQHDVVDHDCDTSCKRSIGDLLGETSNKKGLDTVPVLLYCKDGCKPFKGFGAHSRNIGDMQASFYFRVEKVKKDCCAVLELLRDPYDVTGSDHHGEKRKPKGRNPKDPMDQKTKNLRGTGICITVDLNCFCHVTCLPAINALH